MRRFLLKRMVVLGLIVLVAASFAVANIFPAFRILASWWFALLFSLFSLSLLLSTYDQFRIAKIKLSAVSGPGNSGRLLTVSVETFQLFLKQEGYRKLAGNNECVRYGKGSWGYWGNFVLHLGMTITALFAVVYMVTEHRMVVRAVAGARTSLVGQDHFEIKGIFSRGMPMPPALMLERVKPTFWENGQLKSLSSDIVFFDGEDRQERVQIGINKKIDYRGMKVYQQNSFGSIFLVEFRDNARAFRLPLPMPMPGKVGGAAYGDFEIEGGRYKLKAKYIADIVGKDMMPKNPLLTLRLYEGNKLTGQCSLMMNGSGQLGPYSVSLVDISWWSEVLFDDSMGIPGIFVGFFLLLLGGGIGYFVVPREVLLCRGNDGYTIAWRALKFAYFYQEEECRIAAYGKGNECKAHLQMPGKAPDSNEKGTAGKSSM